MSRVAIDLHVATIPEPPAGTDDTITQAKRGSPKPIEFDHDDEHGCAGQVTLAILLGESAQDGVQVI